MRFILLDSRPFRLLPVYLRYFPPILSFFLCPHPPFRLPLIETLLKGEGFSLSLFFRCFSLFKFTTFLFDYMSFFTLFVNIYSLTFFFFVLKILFFSSLYLSFLSVFSEFFFVYLNIYILIWVSAQLQIAFAKAFFFYNFLCHSFFFLRERIKVLLNVNS